MSPEHHHKLGIEGVMKAKNLLEQLLPDAIGLPFNSYDNPEKLEFADPDGGSFSFDLGGHLHRQSSTALIGAETCEILVEVKNHHTGGDLLTEYKSFLRRSTIAASHKRHARSWFLFLSSVPFGTTLGVQLCDGTTLKTCASSWSSITPQPPSDLADRVVLLIATASMTKFLSHWRPS